MAKQARQSKRDFDIEFQGIKAHPGWTKTLIEDMVYMYSNGQNRDFYKLTTSTKEVVLRRFGEVKDSKELKE